MPQFFAVTSRGLQEPLVDELQSLGMKKIVTGPGGVNFESNWEGCYRVNLASRLASRVLKPVLDFTAYDGEELYGQVLKHDWTKHFLKSQTFKVEAAVQDCKIHDQRFVAMKVKDAVVDQFRDREGERPNVETREPDFKIFVRGYKNQFQVSIDTSGDALFQRGYRTQAGPAPLKENLAAGLVWLSKWDRKQPLIDPMCGSGTILIEAALMAANIAPGTLRTAFGFEKLQEFDEKVFGDVVNDLTSQENEDVEVELFGCDMDRKVLQMAKANARRAGVDHLIQFRSEGISTLKAPATGGMMILNPPYGTRLGDEDNLRDVYRDLGHTLKHEFHGWTAWVLSGNKDLILDMKLKATGRHTVFNGGLECRYLKYEMFQGAAQDARTFRKSKGDSNPS